MKVIDDFLPLETFKTVQQFFLSNQIPWYYNDSIAGINTDLDNYQLCYNFFDIQQPFKESCPCKYSQFIRPVLAKISPKYVLRVKANLRPRTSHMQYCGQFHTDMKINQYTAIFYLNSNNGYTLFEDDTRVFSKENRLCVFHGHTEHAGASCTDQRRRIVLNINYIPNELDPLKF